MGLRAKGKYFSQGIGNTEDADQGPTSNAIPKPIRMVKLKDAEQEQVLSEAQNHNTFMLL